MKVSERRPLQQPEKLGALSLFATTRIRTAWDPLHLFFELASSQARWLELRQSTIAANVANANTPGFKARDVEPFNKVLDGMPVKLALTSPSHIQLKCGRSRDEGQRERDGWTRCTPATP